jgi:cobalt-zinc-cadmium efflux system outer membrane protein
MKHILFWTAVLGLSFSVPALTLDEVLNKALEQSPELRAARAAADAAGADARQAALWENPELEVEAEGLGGDNSGLDSAEYTALISQEFPMFGKLHRDRAVAGYAADAARFNVQETALDFEVRVRKAFVNLQAAEHIDEIRAQQLRLAEDFLKTARKRHEAGAASEMEVLRAEMELEEKAGEKTAAGKRLEAARNRLARLSGVPDIGKTEGDFFQTLEVSDVFSLKSSHPVLQRFQTLEKQADAEFLREKLAWLPDVTLSAGARYEEDGNVHTYLVGAAFPLPLFNRGQAGRAAALFRAETARAETELVRRELELELAELIAEFETASAEALRVREQRLPKAERAAELCREGYSSGRYGWMEMIEMQQLLEETRVQNAEAQREAWMAHIELSKFKLGEE